MMNATQTQPTGTIEHIDPTTLLIERNIRTDVTEADLAPGFVESIRENGVIQPVVGWRDAEGVHVRYGQRRTLGARVAGTATIPVYVVDVDQADDAKRLIDQLVENEQRTEISDADRAAAWKALTLEGLSVTAIAKRTGEKRDRVKAGVAVAKSETGSRLIGSEGLTLDQAAQLLDFEDDPDLIATLTQTATEEPDYFPVRLQRARDDRAAAAAREAAEQIEAAKGHRILSESPAYDAPTPHRLYDLRTADGERVTEELITGKEGVAVYVVGHRDGDARITYYVDDPDALGLTVVNNRRASGPMTDEQKAERKILIANNKEWDAAETVRREWLTTFLSRKTLPKDAAQVIARGLTEARHLVEGGMNQGNRLAATLLNIEPSNSYFSDALADYLQAHPTKAGHVTLAVVLGGIESSTGRGSWRAPDERVAAYLKALASWGYTLSPVEKIAAKITDDTPASE